MKVLNKARSMSLVLGLALVVVLAMPATSLAATPTVKLGTTAQFAILAGTTITNTGPTTITGDVGLYPGSAYVSTGVTLNGATHIHDAVATKAKTDLVTAYNDAAGRPVTGNTPVDLTGLTLGPGVYNSGGVLALTGALTLDAKGDPNAVFIFQSSATLDAASGSVVNLINGARPCQVFWVVPSTATLETGASFKGHIFAHTSIHMMTGATIQGQLLAQTGEVTLDNNVITRAVCPAPSTTPTANGAKLPTTATPWYNLLAAGLVLMLLGFVGYVATARKIHG